MYADRMTGSMQRAIEETNRRRTMQIDYNKSIISRLTIRKTVELRAVTEEGLPKEDSFNYFVDMEAEMHRTAKDLDFEKAVKLRDRIAKLREEM
jgi:excinuclease ABC subunit B